MRRTIFPPRALFPGGFSYAGESVTADSLLLSAFVRPGHSVGIDLGCGCGILSLLLLWTYPSLSMDCVDVRADALSLLRDNLIRNRWEHRALLRECDLRQLSPGRTYDFVITNPPYYPPGHGRSSPEDDRRTMREESASLPELCRCAAMLLSEGGSFYIVHLPAREQELLSAMEHAGIPAVRRQVFCPSEGKAPSLLLLEGRKGDPSPLLREPEILQFGPDGRETASYRKITHWEA